MSGCTSSGPSSDECRDRRECSHSKKKLRPQVHVRALRRFAPDSTSSPSQLVSLLLSSLPKGLLTLHSARSMFWKIQPAGDMFSAVNRQSSKTLPDSLGQPDWLIR